MKSILNLVFVLAFGVFGHIRAQDSLPSGVAGNRPAFYNGTQDKLFPVGDVKDAYAEMRKVWHSRSLFQFHRHLLRILPTIPKGSDINNI